MGLWGGLVSMVSSAVSAVGSALGSVAGSIGAMAGGFLKVAAPFLGPIGQIVSIVANLIGILKPGDNVDELGAKAMQADKKPEDFESNAEYIDYLRDEVELDKEKFDKAGDVEKMARTAVGVSVVAKGIEEKKGFDIPIEAWVAMAKLGLQDKAKEIDTILETFKDGKLDDFAKYVDGKLESSKELEVGDTLVEMYKELEPNATVEDIENKVGKMEIGDK